MKRWHALYTKPRKEYQVDAWLQDRGIETYLPTVRRRVQRRDRSERMIYFPCYLFACLDFEVTPRSNIQWMPGLRRIVSVGDEPAEVPEQLIELVRRRIEVIDERGYCAFQPGDRVRITAGPLRDLEAVFDRPLPAAERVRILLYVLGHVTPIELDGSWIERSDGR